MRLPLDKFMEKLGLGRVLHPYETQPWFLYDEAQGITCSAEIRMGPRGDDIEAEIQFLYDTPPDDEEEDDGSQSGAQGGLPPEPDPMPKKYGGMMGEGRQQVLWMRAEPMIAGEWGPKLLRIKGKDFVNAFHNWDEKGCDFFAACVQSIMMDQLPNLDILLDEHMSDEDSWGGGRRGRAGRKSPKVKPGALMGMKK